MSMSFEPGIGSRYRQVLLLGVLAAVGLVLSQAAFWVSIAAAAAALIALLILLDAFFFAGAVYDNCAEPTAISGLLQLLPWCVFPLVQTDFSNHGLTGLAFASGIFNTIGFYLYFQALVHDQDAVSISIMWNLMIALVPLLAWLALGEQLSIVQYVGIALVFVGACMGTLNKTKLKKSMVQAMAGATVFISVGIVMMKHVFNGLDVVGNTSPFWSGYLPHTAGSATVGLFCLVGLMARRRTRLHFLPLVKRLWPIFLMMELVQVSADLLYSLALSLGLASIVTAMDGLMGIFSAGFALLAVRVLGDGRYSKVAEEMHRNQLLNFPAKLAGMGAITVGAYLIV